MKPRSNDLELRPEIWGVRGFLGNEWLSKIVGPHNRCLPQFEGIYPTVTYITLGTSKERLKWRICWASNPIIDLLLTSWDIQVASWVCAGDHTHDLWAFGFACQGVLCDPDLACDFVSWSHFSGHLHGWWTSGISFVALCRWRLRSQGEVLRLRPIVLDLPFSLPSWAFWSR